MDEALEMAWREDKEFEQIRKVAEWDGERERIDSRLMNSLQFHCED